MADEPDKTLGARYRHPVLGEAEIVESEAATDQWGQEIHPPDVSLRLALKSGGDLFCNGKDLKFLEYIGPADSTEE